MGDPDWGEVSERREESYNSNRAERMNRAVAQMQELTKLRDENARLKQRIIELERKKTKP